MKSVSTIVIATLLLCCTPAARGMRLAGPQKPQLQDKPQPNRRRTTALIVDEVRHQLVTLPYYGVFDWLEAEVLPDDTVVLRGQVSRPTIKSDAEARVRKLESVAKVVNEIEVLPLSQSDDGIRLAMYRAIFKYDSPLFKYAIRAVPPIHILVKNGRATLKGLVANDMDRQLAYIAARGVPGVFDVKNELQVEPKS